MEQLKQLLQLKGDGIGIREMARRLGVSRNSVRKYLSLLDDASDRQLTSTEQITGIPSLFAKIHTSLYLCN